MTDRLESGVRQFHRRTSEDYARLGADVSTLGQRRAVAEQVREPWRSGGPAMASSETLTVTPPGVRIRIHRPVAGDDLPVLVYLHGGGWTLFSIDTHDRLMREYAARSGCAVLGVDYSLAPEARFPTALDEVAAVLAFIADSGREHGLDPARIALGGDSAGGNLALASALRALGQMPLGALLLNYAALDPDPTGSYALYDSDDFMLLSEEMADFWRNYLGEDFAASRDPLARPLLAELDGLPPTFLCIAECDILCDENLALAERLRSAGVDTQAVVYPGASHSFLEAVEVSPLADRALGEASAWLRRQLG
ncbi:alpha/beta hydrolase [Sphingomonas ginkgonis]|uniref:Alpha/beta hydrolase n=1 Tax=Sphingomonas ginkgonis TaxID=2315330 RepID=A0A429V8K5_9SPHN|nr:alpha/beta hydrolase [Sphingomonas ginkgonis]RST30264.1 alpha/beta hydrolase [Sphingomonas ginkgonis]